MNLTKREEQIWDELHEWHQSFFEYETSNLENAYDKWVDQAFSLLPETVQIQFFEKLDSWLFHLNSLLRGTKLQNEASKRILNAAKALNEDVQSFADMRSMPVGQLTFIAEQQAAKHRLYSLIQGGIAGSSNTVLVSSDFLAFVVINLRAIQLTAMSFGYDVQSPQALLETLKVFNVATLPDRMKMIGIEELVADLKKSDQQFYFESEKRITDPSSLDEPIKQLFKIALIAMFSKKGISGLPLFSMAIGAGINYQTTRKVTRFALKYYQYKHLLKKKEGHV